MSEKVALSDAQARVLSTLTQNGRCVASRTTDPRCGYVNVAAAKALVQLGLARQDEGHHGVAVFVITDAGWAHWWDEFLPDEGTLFREEMRAAS